MSEDLNQAVPIRPTEAVPPVTAADSNDPVAMRNKLELAGLIVKQNATECGS